MKVDCVMLAPPPPAQHAVDPSKKAPPSVSESWLLTLFAVKVTLLTWFRPYSLYTAPPKPASWDPTPVAVLPVKESPVNSVSSSMKRAPPTALLLEFLALLDVKEELSMATGPSTLSMAPPPDEGAVVGCRVVGEGIIVQADRPVVVVDAPRRHRSCRCRRLPYCR